MDRLYFCLVRGCAQAHFSRLTVTPLPSERWPALLNELHPMNYGRLLSFYYFMDMCDAPLTEQYRFHQVLCVTYPVHYPSVWWMVWQLIKSVWTDVSCQIV